MGRKGDARRSRGEGQAPRLDDPVWRSSLREALLILLVWGALCAVTLAVSFLLGSGIAPGRLRAVAGIPLWVIWGVIVPWIAAVIFSWWFAFRFIEDHELEAVEGESEGDNVEHRRG